MASAVEHRTLLVALGVAGVLLVIGAWTLDLQARQTRDTRRKLDLEDIETALNRLLIQTGTLPPADAPIWCGTLTAPEHRTVREPIERALRETKKYAKLDKPFPTDPRDGGGANDYLYWKTGPVSFELLAHLEADSNDSRPFQLARCSLELSDTRSSVLRRLGVPIRRLFRHGPGTGYDYALISLQRSSP